MRRIAAVALVMVTATACTGDAEPVRPVAASAPVRVPPKVTLDEAARAFRTYVATDAVARGSGDVRLAQDLSRDGRTRIVMAQFEQSLVKGERPARYEWGEPTLLVPRLDRFPHWFAAVAERRSGQARETVLLVFMRVEKDLELREDGRWRVAVHSVLDRGVTLPKAALDAEGYAVPLATFDESLAVSPRLVGPLHATLAEEGSSGAAADLVAPGHHTTRYHADIQRDEQRYQRAGMHYDSIFGAANYPIFALRTEGGGALVLYALNRTTKWEAQTYNVVRIDVPPNALPVTVDPVYRTRLVVEEIHNYVAEVPAKGGGPVRVIGYDGAVTRTSGK
ncbi:hypothetical protein [Rhizohabitans arisaemae]|uniref:hypothetical protein n=1 Tax=Rhizohabitans arisaemae TaxID=2720610 RepID=UPI0024B285F5|nr:hypothetical protein [Rhizohabitans arisaemae]